MPTARSIELHFQELFSGEHVEVLHNGRTVAAFAAKTRMQIGLAHIEHLDVVDGDTVAVVVEGQRIEVPLAPDADRYLVRLADGTTSITPASGVIEYA
jgi:hypothetical protein